jgi:hypothetical protein
MARCYLTGIEFPIEDGYVLDKSTVHREVRTLKAKTQNLARLLDLLGPTDRTSLRQKTVLRRRLVCRDVAQALSAGLGGQSVFLSWRDFRAQRLVYMAQAMQKEPRYADLIGSVGTTALRRGACLASEALRCIKIARRGDVHLQKEVLSIACRLPEGSTVHALVTELRAVRALNKHLLSSEPGSNEPPDS